MSAESIPASPIAELDAMHELYRHGGRERGMTPQVVYPDANFPHAGCQQRLQAIDFRREAHGRAVHDPLVRAWWDDAALVGRCPGCHGWVHFTIRSKRAVTAEEAARLPRLPDNWHVMAVIL